MNAYEAAFTNPSGGLSYHMSAWRWKKSLWMPFVSKLETWLCEEWNPQESSLVLFGPSAGWTLSEGFFSRFDEILAVEPDPLARFLLRRRFPKCRWRFETSANGLPWFDSTDRNFRTLLEKNSKCAVLFSNLLGQVPLLMNAKLDADDSFAETGRERFLPALENRNWASYHDLISTRQPFKDGSHAIEAREIKKNVKRTSLENLVDQFFLPGTEVLDHQTDWLETQNPTVYVPWRLKPETSHLIACIRT